VPDDVLPQFWQSWASSREATHELWRLYKHTKDSSIRDSTGITILRLCQRVGPEADPVAAVQVLDTLLTAPRRLSDVQGLLVHARLSIEHGYAIALHKLAWNRNLRQVRRAREQCESLIGQPLTLSSGLSDADRARVYTLQALLALTDAFCHELEQRVEHLEKAEDAALTAFQNALAARDHYLLMDVGLLMAEHMYLAHCDGRTLPTEVVIDKIENAFLDAWHVMNTMCPEASANCLQLARMASLNAQRAVLRATRGRKADAQALADRSAYELRLLENHACCDWEVRLRADADEEVRALWRRAKLRPSTGHYSISGIYRADSPDDGESA